MTPRIHTEYELNPQRTPFSDELRAAVIDSGMKPSQICNDTGIDLGSMSKFLRGYRGISLENVDRLADYLGLHVARKGWR